MTPVQMFEECRTAMSQPGVCGVVLTASKGSLPKGFPRGELLNEMKRNGLIERTYHYEPEKLLSWLVKNFPETARQIVGASIPVAIETPP